MNTIDEELRLEGLYDLPFIDIATGYAVPLEEAPSVATMISSEDIKAMGALSLEEILESVPGIHVQPSTLTASSVISIRGMHTTQTPQVLLLLNGYRISSDVSSNIFPSSAVINIKNIERIAIVRGPGSAVYGADAFSGVINIVTKNYRDIKGYQIGGRGGSFNTKNLWGRYAEKFADDWKLAFNFEYMDQGADKSRIVNSDAQTALDELFGTSASLAPGYIDRRLKALTYNLHMSNSNWKFGIDGWRQRDIGQGAGIGQALDENGYADIDEILFSLEYETKKWWPELTFNAKFSYLYIDQQYYLNIFPPGNISAIGSDGNLFTAPFTPISFPDGVIGNPGRESKVPHIDFTFLYSGFLAQTWRLNFGAKVEKLESKSTANFGSGVIDGTELVVDGGVTDTTNTEYIYVPNKQRNIKYLSVQNVWELTPDWSLTVGLRYDNYSDFGSTVNPRLALVWMPIDSLTTKLLYGRAFRAPSFTELYGQNNPVVQGNPALKPEIINTYELAFTYEVSHDLKTNASFYYYSAKDMIDFIGNEDGSKTAQNFNSITGRGIEIEGHYDLNDYWLFKANYTYQKTINEDFDKQRPYVPRQQFYLQARWKFMPDWMASAQLNWVGNRKREQFDLREDIDDYTQVNFTLRRENIARHWNLSLAVKNLFDADIREPSNGNIADDYPMNERSAFLELSYHFER